MQGDLVFYSIIATGVALAIMFNVFSFLDCYDFSWWMEGIVRFIVPILMLAMLALDYWYMDGHSLQNSGNKVTLVIILMLWGPLISIPLYSYWFSLSPVANKTLLAIGTLSAPLGFMVRKAIHEKTLTDPIWDTVMRVLFGTHVVLSIVVYGLVLIFLVSMFFLVARQAALVGAMWPNNE